MTAGPLDSHPPLAIKLRSGIVLTKPSVRWHVELLVEAGIPEDQWGEVVAESGFVDSQGIFVAGHGVRVLEGGYYFTQPIEETQGEDL
jgi:hypothetical protein